MMKKFKLKGLKLTSPRKEHHIDEPPQSPLSIDSADDSYCTPDEKPDTTPKRHSFFNTIRKKLSSIRKNDDRRGQNWADGESCSGINTLPKANTSSWRAAPRHVTKPLRPAVSEERLSGSSPDFLRRARIARNAHSSRDGYHDRFVSHENSNASSKSDEESEKDESQDKELLPMDTEYGHASAPSSNEQSAVIPTSSSCESDAGDMGAAPVTCSEESAQTDENITRSSHPNSGLPLSPERNTTASEATSIPIRTSKPWSLTDELFRLSKYGWYWGPITRVEAEEKLLNQPDGAFLVRDSSDERYLLSLSFRSYGRTLHTRIEHCNGVFSFYAQPECEGYKSVVALIVNSMTDSQTGVFCYSRARTPGAPSFPVRLTKPVSRFTHVRSLQYLCRFVIRQNTRYDYLQMLPLPTSIKGWLEENQY